MAEFKTGEILSQSNLDRNEQVSKAPVYGEPIGPIKMGTIERVMGGERARPILDAIKESESRHAAAAHALGICARRHY